MQFVRGPEYFAIFSRLIVFSDVCNPSWLWEKVGMQELVISGLLFCDGNDLMF